MIIRPRVPYSTSLLSGVMCWEPTPHSCWQSTYLRHGALTGSQTGVAGAGGGHTHPGIGREGPDAAAEICETPAFLAAPALLIPGHAKKPNLSGTWTLDPASAPYRLVA